MSTISTNNSLCSLWGSPSSNRITQNCQCELLTASRHSCSPCQSFQRKGDHQVRFILPVSSPFLGPRLRQTRPRRGKPRPRRDRISIAIGAYVVRINIIISKSKAGPRPVSALLSFSPFPVSFTSSFAVSFPRGAYALVHQRTRYPCALLFSFSRFYLVSPYLYLPLTFEF